MSTGIDESVTRVHLPHTPTASRATSPHLELPEKCRLGIVFSIRRAHEDTCVVGMSIRGRICGGDSGQCLGEPTMLLSQGCMYELHFRLLSYVSQSLSNLIMQVLSMIMTTHHNSALPLESTECIFVRSRGNRQY